MMVLATLKIEGPQQTWTLIESVMRFSKQPVVKPSKKKGEIKPESLDLSLSTTLHSKSPEDIGLFV